MIKRIFLLILIVCISGFLLLLTGTYNKKIEHQTTTKTETLKNTKIPDIKLQENKLQQIDKDGNVVWELHSEKIEKYSEKEIYIANARGLFYEKKIPKLEFSANRLVFDNTTKNFEVLDNFFAYSKEDNLKISTQNMKWDSKKRKLYSNSGVSLTKENIKITSDTLEIDIELKVAKMKGNTKTEVIVN